MFCSNCGKEIDDDSKFCQYCGANTNAELNSNNSNNKENKNVICSIIKRKGLIVSLIVVLILYLSVLALINTEWYINNTTAISEKSYKSAGKRLIIDYNGKYENGKIRSKVCLVNLNNDVYTFGRVMLGNDFEAISVIFSGIDDLKISSAKISFGDLSKEKDNEYCANLTLDISKKEARKIKKIHYKYAEGLDLTYAELLK